MKHSGTFQVGVTADMGISIDGGEEYREGVLTITEVNAIKIVEYKKVFKNRGMLLPLLLGQLWKKGKVKVFNNKF